MHDKKTCFQPKTEPAEPPKRNKKDEFKRFGWSRNEIVDDPDKIDYEKDASDMDETEDWKICLRLIRELNTTN